jgi:hypothetical protein
VSPKYTLFADDRNQPPQYSDENWIIARCIDDLVEMVTLNPPDRVLFGPWCSFERDAIDWLRESAPLTPYKIFEED